MRGAAHPAKRSAAGFTLLEVLLALTLMGMLSTLLFGGVRFGARVWETAEKRSESLVDVQVAQSLIRRTLERARPRFVYDAEGNDQGILFTGAADQIIVAAPAPAALIEGGMYYVRIASLPTPEGRQLEFAYRLIDDAGTVAGREDVLARRVLLDHLAAVEFAYFGTPQFGEAPVWVPQWDGALGMAPMLISIRIRFPDGDRRQWPDLIVAPAVLGSVLG